MLQSAASDCETGASTREESEIQKMSTLVIFLHGLTGNQHSWGAVPDFIQESGFEIATPTYAASIRSAADVTASARQIMTLIETRYAESAPIFLVGHSLGGLVAREISRQLLLNGPDALLMRIPAAITVGTPLEGARYGTRFLRSFWFLSPKIHQIATHQYAFDAYRQAIREAKKRAVARPKQLHIEMEEDGVIARQEVAHFTEDDRSVAVIPGTHRNFNAKNDDARYVADVLLAEIRRLLKPETAKNRLGAIASGAASSVSQQHLTYPESDVRLAFKWDDEQLPARANFTFKIFAQNRGPLDADIGDVFAEFRAADDDSPAFINSNPRPFNTLFRSGQGRDVYSAQLPNGDESLLCCGFVRWADKTDASWEQLFRMQLRAHPGPNENHFTQVGRAPWNHVSPISGIAPNHLPGAATEPVQVLQMEVGENGKFFSTTGGLWDTKRTFNLKLSNMHSYKTATNCKVHVTTIEPQDEFVGPWVLKEIPSLPAGDYVFIPLALYGEARDPEKYNCADSFFTTYLGSPGHPGFDIGKTYVFTLRATAADIPMCEFRCRLWVDSEGRFRIASG
jgi:pimeloyl-ACP methyl ester carboxylesterase